jgi:hypothetical protein
MTEYASTVVARKEHPCDDTRGNRYLRGRHTIPAGTPYVRCVAFPGSDINQSTRPWTVRICPDCYCQYGATMPAPKRSATTP